MADVKFINVVRALLHYDPDTGLFSWLADNVNKIKKGDAAGYISLGYVRITINDRAHMAHRLAWHYMTGKPPIQEIDHINGIKSDNRFTNLRCVSHQENMKNKRIHKNNSSGHIGVYRRHDTGQWRSQIRVESKNYNLGTFNTLDEAVAARTAATKSHRFHANHGTIGESNVTR